MAFDARLVISLGSPRDENLSRPQARFLAAVQERIVQAGFRIRPDSPTTDGVRQRFESIGQTHGAVVLAFSQWEASRLYREQKQNKTVFMPSEFSHLGICMAVAARRPLLVLREKTVAFRGALRKGYITRQLDIPNNLRPDWLTTQEFETVFQYWKDDVNCFRHVFLGYSSQASESCQPDLCLPE